MSEAKIPAGWYPDPQDTTSDPRPERWWDGAGWTATTRPGGAAASAEEESAEERTAVLDVARTDGDQGGEQAGDPAGDPGSDPGSGLGSEGPRVIEGEVLDNGTVRFPEPPTAAAFGAEGFPAPKKPSLRKRLLRPVVVAAAVAGLLGLAVGSGATYLAVDHHDKDGKHPQAAPQNTQQPGHKRGQNGNGGGLNGGGNGGGNNNGSGGNGFNGGSGGSGGLGGNGGSGGSGGFPGFPGFPGFGGSGGNGGSGGGANGGGSGGGASRSGVAADEVNGISLPIPAGWQGGTTRAGTAALSIGEYQCPGSTGSGGSGGSGDSGGSATTTCSLGGVNTDRIEGTDPQAAAKSDIVAAAKESYGNIKSHQELKSEPVTVDGRSGYLVRWQVGAEQGNDGTVESVVFPSADGKSLISVRLGFDIAAKAPAVSVMDTIISGIADYQGGGGSAGGGTNT
ncbi:hypothetical protein GCM10009665_05640 [Kitasatospora nipponensis]|uniref:DUF2510 domain-containing protein n=1 Tax=Kitasatospora nipponensis TaxID=258049 RepID=A0ABN1VP83_9ACTN